MNRRTLLDHIRRARIYGLPATLTMKEWRETLTHFRGACAYCGEQAEIELDHFVPLQLGGGTIKCNCVPSCKVCNARKGPRDPYKMANVFPEIPAIYDYLAAFAPNGMPVPHPCAPDPESGLKKMVSHRLSKQTIEIIERESNKRGISKTAYVEHAILKVAELIKAGKLNDVNTFGAGEGES